MIPSLDAGGQHSPRGIGALSYEPQIIAERARLAKILGDVERVAGLEKEAHRMYTAMGASGWAERLAKELS